MEAKQEPLILTTQQVAAICKALGDNKRVQIVQRLIQGELCACKLLEQFAITQPTLSHHMKVLTACGLVLCRKEGKWCHYRLNCNRFQAFKQFINSLCCCYTEQEKAEK